MRATFGRRILGCLAFTLGLGSGADAAVDLLGGGRLVAYNPTGYDPRTLGRPSAASVRADAAKLRRRGFRAVATYASTPALARVCRRFKRAGFRTALVGVWNPADARELRAARRARRCADGYVVGSEGLTFGRYGRAVLEAALTWLHANTGRPVTTRETLAAYGADPGLLGLGDWVFPTVHPYFAGVTEPAAACRWTAARYAELRAAAPAGQRVVLAETGLPTAGDTGLDEAGQAAFFACLEAAGVPFAFFEAFDQPWKTTLPVEPHWGLFHADGTPKAWAIAQKLPAVASRPDAGAR